jgi:hypothetical protein
MGWAGSYELEDRSWGKTKTDVSGQQSGVRGLNRLKVKGGKVGRYAEEKERGDTERWARHQYRKPKSQRGIRRPEPTGSSSRAR